jgi:SHS2 domain-containing protein
MSYRYKEQSGFADLQFVAEGKDLSDLFISCWDACLGAMIENPGAVKPEQEKTIHIKEEDPEFLLYDFLGFLVYYKDTEALALRISSLRAEPDGDIWVLEARAEGEAIDPQRHGSGADIKAVTFHQLSVEQDPSGLWTATVLLDI